MDGDIPDICHFFYTSKIFGEWKRVNYNKIHSKLPIFLRYYGKIHSKLPIFRVKSVKIYTGQKKFTRIYSWGSWQIWGMVWSCKPCEWMFRTTTCRINCIQFLLRPRPLREWYKALPKDSPTSLFWDIDSGGPKWIWQVVTKMWRFEVIIFNVQRTYPLLPLVFQFIIM